MTRRVGHAVVQKLRGCRFSWIKPHRFCLVSFIHTYILYYVFIATSDVNTLRSVMSAEKNSREYITISYVVCIRVNNYRILKRLRFGYSYGVKKTAFQKKFSNKPYNIPPESGYQLRPL